MIPILFHHYKGLKECMEDVKQIEEAAGAGSTTTNTTIEVIEDPPTIKVDEGRAAMMMVISRSS
jgi:hypothetical protein